MKNLKELREERAKLHASAQAIVDVATSDKRELTAEESQQVDRVFGRGKAGEANYAAGELDKIDERIAQAEKIEARAAEIAGKQASQNYQGSQAHHVVKLPAIAKQRHGKLMGFDSKEDAFTAGAWAAAQLIGNRQAREYCGNLGLQIFDAHSGSDNGSGGFLVPEVLENSIIRLVETYGAFRANARVMPMASDTVNIPRNTSDVTAYFVNEVPTSITESSLTVALAQLQAKVMAVRSLISNDLIEDAIIDLANLVAVSAATKFAEKEDDCGFNGDGTSTYGGIVGLKGAIAAGSKYTAATGNTAFGTLDKEDFEGMVGLLPLYAQSNAKWYISNVGWAASMMRLQDAAGGNNVADLGSGPMLQFLGYPVVKVQKMNTTTGAQTSTDGLCYLGDLSMTATLGVRRGVRIQVLRELYAGTRQTGLIIDQRIDINVHERGTASVAGPMVMLSTPGA